MTARTAPPAPAALRQRGMTLIEVLVATAILTGVIAMVMTILISTTHLHSKTMRRVEAQGDARQALSLLSMEVRQAGADPSNPPVGVTAVVQADSVTLRVRSDLNGNGVIDTAEPSEDVTYHYDPGSRTLTRNPGAGAATLLTGVSNLRFSFFDAAGNPLLAMPLSAADAALVHSVGVTFATVGRDSVTLNLSTTITLRNQ
ncbi:MAG TPA: prepilin-type N-terminal cleavage/methylation domain-containing protein [Dongiaceae bacterium]|nr:prepilin-type N-terminal cleavage/methylation domain-containing protein [Dongiaceae bacterium]